MISIIDAFNSNSDLNFSFSSSKASSFYLASNALNKEGYYFSSGDTNAFWQISFSQPVSIESYIISGPSSLTYWQTSWEISYALDDSTFITKQTDEMKNFKENTQKFPINPPIYCKHFKITGKTHTLSETSSCLNFYCFDCFGSLKKLNEENTRCKNYVMKQFLINLLISLMIHFSPS